MRDPGGTLQFEDSTVIRRLRAPLDDRHFLNSTLARQWVERGHLVKFEITSPQTVVAQRLAFITLPTEWSDAQLYAAAELTLQLQGEAVEAGFDLKDASAWNIIFDGTRPVFCDLLSFAPLTEKKWWAAGQFARHFLIPLVVSRRRGLLTHQVFKGWRDGMPPDVGRRFLGPARFLTRHWPLMAGGNSPTNSINTTRQPEASLTEIQSFRRSLQASFSWMLKGAKPRETQAVSSPWARYTENRNHYDSRAMTDKLRQVQTWLERLRPDWVADLGCNTGEFTRIAADCGANVVALDADHDAVQSLFVSATLSQKVHPVLSSLDDFLGSRGWAGAEFPGLFTRLEKQCDLVMMLALIHHLAVSASIPLEAIAQFAAKCTRNWLIVELIDVDDPQLLLLCSQHRRNPSDFSAQLQRDAFLDAGFVIDDENSLSPSQRTLLLLKRSK